MARLVFPQVFNGARSDRISSVSLRLEGAIANWKPARVKTDPTTNFWTVYKKVADEHDNDMASKYLGDLDTSLLFVSVLTSLPASYSPQPGSFLC
jgi:hypothetical protein